MQFKNIIHHIKNGTLIKTVRAKFFIKNNLHNPNVTDKQYLIGLGKIKIGYEMDLDNPKTFNEYLNYLKLHSDPDELNKYVNKITIKEHISSIGLGKYIIPTIKTYKSIDDINLDDLPDEFVIKNSLDSGGVCL